LRNGSAPEEGRTLAFLEGGGETGALMRSLDWSHSPLGPPSEWPQALRTVVGLMLGSKFPMFVAWGPEFGFLYNDAYAVILGAKHPQAMGDRFENIWKEIWSDVGPLARAAMNGEATWLEDLPLVMNRKGYDEQTWFTFSYSPVRDDNGRVAGMFCAVAETTEKVLAQRQLAEDAERQQRLFEQAPGFIIIMRGPDHVVEFVNDAHKRTFGSDNWEGRTIREAFPSLAGQGFFEVLDRVYTTGETYEADAVNVSFQRGADRPVETRALTFIYAPLHDASGNIAGIFCEGFDVTEGAHAHLRHEALSAFADVSRDYEDPDAIAYAAAEVLGRTLQVSRAGYGTIDTAAETITIERDWNAPGVKSIAGVLSFRDYGSYIEDLTAGRTVVVANADSDLRTRDTAEALKAISAHSFVNIPVTEQGDTVALLFLNHAEPREWRPDELELIREFAERTRTAVERRRAELALRESAEALEELNRTLEQRVVEALAEKKVFADIVESTDAFVQIADPDFNFLAINKASADEFERIFGVRPSAGDNMLELLAHRPEHQAAVRSVWSRALAGEAFTEIGEFGDPEFDRRFYEMKYNPLRDAEGKPSGAYQFVYDVTDRLRDQRRLLEAEQALRQSQKMEAVGQLVSGLAHDFNNVLGAIVAALDMIRRRGDEPERVRRFADAAMQAADRGAKLTAQLLAFSRTQRIQLTSLLVCDVIRKIADLLDRTVGPMIEVEFGLNPAPVPVLTDATQVEMTLLNLALNARDAMPDGGKLFIGTAVRGISGDPELEAGEYVELTVRDTGIGMDEHVLNRALDPFFTTKEVGKGTGLGLAQVYGSARQSGGTVRIESKVGEGTTVRVLFRRTDADARPRLPESSGDGLSSGSGRIVLIDDDDDLRGVVSSALQALGYDVTAAGDGPSGLQALRSSRPDALVVDFAMPGMNGAEVAEQAREIHPGLPIVLASGYADTDAIERAVGKDAKLLRKPFRIDELLEAVGEVVQLAMT
jgi:PAS domain S-box-containing protein